MSRHHRATRLSMSEDAIVRTAARLQQTSMSEMIRVGAVEHATVIVSGGRRMSIVLQLETWQLVEAAAKAASVDLEIFVANATAKAAQSQLGRLAE